MNEKVFKAKQQRLFVLARKRVLKRVARARQQKIKTMFMLKRRQLERWGDERCR